MNKYKNMMGNNEYLDILDEQGNKIGKTDTRENIHKNGIIHSEVTAVIYTENGAVLLQKRNSNKKTYAGVWSTTGGHVLAGESKQEAIIREVKEELNLDVKIQNIENVVTYHSISKKGKIINNKFITIFLIKICEDDINKIKIQEEELEKIKFITIDELKELVNKDEKGYKFPQKMKEILEKLGSGKNDNNI